MLHALQAHGPWHDVKAKAAFLSTASTGQSSPVPTPRAAQRQLCWPDHSWISSLYSLQNLTEEKSPSLRSAEVSISSFCMSRPFYHVVNFFPMHEPQI